MGLVLRMFALWKQMEGNGDRIQKPGGWRGKLILFKKQYQGLFTAEHNNVSNLCLLEVR